MLQTLDSAYDVFLLRLDQGGNHLFSAGYGTTGEQSSLDIRGAGGGNIYIAGSYQETIDFGGGPVPMATDFDVFLAKLGP